MSVPADLSAKIDEYKAALARDPKSTLFVALADAYRQAGQVDDALEVALRGTWELPQFADGYAAVGRVYSQRRVFGKAEAAFYRALSVNQMCIPAYKGLATIYRNQGDAQKASDILTKAIMLDPGDMSLQKMIESLSSPTGVAREADQVISEPIAEQEPAMPQTSGGMKPITTATIADIYIEQGLYDKALEVYHELLSENPQNVSVQQKILELEALMNGGVPEKPAMESVAPEIPPIQGGDGSDSFIDQLNQWLAAIQARRNRV